MNFLAHYYCLSKQESHYTVLGAIIPDIVKDFSRIYNKKLAAKTIEYYKTDECRKIYRGIELHIKKDKIFHNHQLFKKFEYEANSILKITFGDKLKRKFVLAHVLVEIIIDHFIIIQNIEKLENFYKKLQKIDLLKSIRFFEKINILENESHFIKNFERFKKIEFIYHLKDTEGIIFTLDKVFNTIVNHDFIADSKKWQLAIDSIILLMKEEVFDMLKDIKSKLYEIKE